MAEDLMVVLRRSEISGFGFSLLGAHGYPHVIYDIIENSPAAECGKVEAGDIIVKVNGTDVHRYTTKEVLKCLRLSDDLVTLELKRDPNIKAKIKEYLARTSHNIHNSDIEPLNLNIYDIKSSSTKTRIKDQHQQQSSENINLLKKSPTYSSSSSSSIGGPPTNFHQQQQHQSQRVLNSPTNTDSLNRPSRIPTVAKKASQKINQNQSPQHKKPKPSQIPAKGSISNALISSHHQISNQQQQPSFGNNGYNSNSERNNLIGSNSSTTTSANSVNTFANNTQQFHSFSQQQQQQQQQQNEPASQRPGKARFEAYMMTGDLILNISRTSQSSNLIGTHARKVDSLRDSPSRQRPQLQRQQHQQQQPNGALAPRASGETTPSSSSPSLSESSDSIKNYIKNRDKNKNSDNSNNSTNCSSQGSNGLSDNKDDDFTQEQTNNEEDILNEQDEDEEGCDYDGDNEYSQQQQSNHEQQHHHHHHHHRQEISSKRQNSLQQHLINNDANDDTSACVTFSSSSNINRDCLDSSSVKINSQNQKPSENFGAEISVNNSVFGSGGSGVLTGETVNVDSRRQHRSSSSSSTIKSDIVSTPEETSFSVPTSPVSLSTPLLDNKESANSLPTSPEQSAPAEIVVRRQHNGVIVRKCDSAGFRTSKSEDHLQQAQREGIGAVIPIDIDEDVNSSLNTLLDTHQDSEGSQTSIRDRIVWTYNAPVPHPVNQSSPNSHSSSISTSPQHTTDSPQSPTSVSSSVMSSNSGSKGGHAIGVGGYATSTIGGANHIPINNSNSGTTGAGYHLSRNSSGNNQALTTGGNGTGFLSCPTNGGDQSVSEAVSNISSPDYQDDDNLLSSKDLMGLSLSDPSDSDSTILVSDAMQRKQQQEKNASNNKQEQHKLVIQVKGLNNSEGSGSNIRMNSELKDSEDELATLTEEPPTVILGGQDTKESSPPVSDDGSDVDSLHSYHYSPKAVDMPSAIRLAKRLYSLDGFKKSDVSRHLGKNNDFSRAVADEYLKYFNFDNKTLDQALREFLKQFSLSGETQERERVLVHFSKRYLDCNPGTFNSQDAAHTLTCAIMLLNTDLHGPNIGRKMTCTDFIANLAELNDGENFPKDVLRYLYHAIKSQPLEWALDEDSPEQPKSRNDGNLNSTQVGNNPFLDAPPSSAAIEYKKGYVMRKSCYEPNYKKTPFGKRSWKMFYCTLRDLVLYLHKDEHGFRKSQMSDNLHNAIRIHHALATKASDYTKKQHVFRLQTADQSEYLFQTSDSKELQSWIDTINYVCAAFSAPPLEGGVGSQKRFQRPLLPSTHTKLLIKEQLRSHEEQVTQLENTLTEHKKGPIPNKGLPLQNYKEKENYLNYELKRYKTYVSILNAKMIADQQLEMQQQNCLLDEQFNLAQRNLGTAIGNTSSIPVNNILQQQISDAQQQQQPPSDSNNSSGLGNRYGYRPNIYRTSDSQQDIG
ncbi:PH and SEC7 domain-containing protein isoform X2 [Condylostylus longicornis]|uniref:PH and SEC7 domain-containing protein isoform X2 n=1 Tax=Condylostylus longicornis TaxID=2530218 RepID=UPI00244E4FFF|nr:PH and SEC7 domain-containing protein isoform X2 [Condylostylus longicornis]